MEQASPPVPASRGWWAPLLVLSALVAVAPWHVQDPDTLANLATGRWIATHGAVPLHDPFTFTDPQRVWSNPEWLGALLWHLADLAGGDVGLLCLKFVLAGGGLLLCLRLARMHRATTLAAVLLLCALPAASERLTERAHLHAIWLIPACLWLHASWKRDPDRPWLWVAWIALLQVLWANLHGSFILAWGITASEFAAEVAERRDNKRLAPLAALLAASPLLACVAPTGVHNWSQLVDHVVGGPIYRQYIREWQSSGYDPAPLGGVGMAVVLGVGALSLWPAPRRPPVAAILRIAAAAMLCRVSLRFAPEAAMLAVADIATLVTAHLHRVRWMRAARPVLLAAALALCAPAAWAMRTAGRPAVRERLDAPIGVAHYLVEHAPPGTRVFAPFNAGPWLLNEAGDHLRLYIDPRNNLGAQALKHYFQDLVAQPQSFDATAERLGIAAALMNLGDLDLVRLNRHLARDPAWSAVWMDGRYALYLRRDGPLGRLAASDGFARLRGVLPLEYLLEPDSNGHLRAAMDAALQADLSRVGRQGPAWANVVHAWLDLCAQGVPPPRLDGVAVDANGLPRARLLEAAAQRLPASPSVLVYAATAWARAGDLGRGARLLHVAQSIDRSHALALALEAELARVAGQRDMQAKALQRLQARAGPQEVVRQILAAPPP